MRNNPILTLVTVLLSSLSIPITLTGASVALPDIATDLGSDLGSTQLVVAGYNATFASFMLGSGAMADLIGRRKIYAAGVATFTGAGLLSTVAGNIVLLEVLRFIAGLGAAAAASSGAALLAAAFTGTARARAFGFFGTALGAGLAFGPTIAGLLVSALGWRAVFGVPTLAGFVVLLLVRYLPESRKPGAQRVDWAGTVTFTIALMLLIIAVVEGPSQGWTSAPVLAMLAGAAVLFVAFAVVERRQAHPMLDFGLMRNVRFLAISWSGATIVCVVIPLLVLLPSYFTRVLGMSIDEAGAALLLLTAPTLVLPVLGGYLSRWIAPMTIVVTSVALVGLGAVWLTVLSPASTLSDLAGPLLVAGVGMGLSTGLVDGTAVSAVESERAGTAAGMFNTVRLTIETLAIAVFGAIVSTTTAARLAEPGFTDGMQIVLWVMAGMVVLALVLVGLARRPAGKQLVTA